MTIVVDLTNIDDDVPSKSFASSLPGKQPTLNSFFRSQSSIGQSSQSSESGIRKSNNIPQSGLARSDQTSTPGAFVRDAGNSSSYFPLDVWICDKCTLINEPDDANYEYNRCSLCESPRLSLQSSTSSSSSTSSISSISLPPIRDSSKPLSIPSSPVQPCSINQPMETPFQSSFNKDASTHQIPKQSSDLTPLCKNPSLIPPQKDAKSGMKLKKKKRNEEASDDDWDPRNTGSFDDSDSSFSSIDMSASNKLCVNRRKRTSVKMQRKNHDADNDDDDNDDGKPRKKIAKKVSENVMESDSQGSKPKGKSSFISPEELPITSLSSSSIVATSYLDVSDKTALTMKRLETFLLTALQCSLRRSQVLESIPSSHDEPTLHRSYLRAECIYDGISKLFSGNRILATLNSIISSMNSRRLNPTHKDIYECGSDALATLRNEKAKRTAMSLAANILHAIAYNWIPGVRESKNLILNIIPSSSFLLSCAHKALHDFQKCSCPKSHHCDCGFFHAKRLRVATEIVLALPFSHFHPFSKPYTKRLSSTSPPKEVAFTLCAEFFSLLAIGSCLFGHNNECVALVIDDLARLADAAYAIATKCTSVSNHNATKTRARPCFDEYNYDSDDMYVEEISLHNAEDKFLSLSAKKRPRKSSDESDQSTLPVERNPDLLRFVPLSNVVSATLRYPPVSNSNIGGIDVTGLLIASGLIDESSLHGTKSKPKSEENLKAILMAVDKCERVPGSLGIALRLKLVQLLRSFLVDVTPNTAFCLFNAAAASYSSDFINVDDVSFHIHKEVVDAASDFIPTHAFQLFSFIHQS